MAAVDYKEVSSYFSGKNKPTPGAVDIAKFILLNADVKRSPTAQQSTNQPSLMGRIFDVLSRPNYAVANFVKGAVHGNPSLQDIISGLAGTEKTTFSDVLGDIGVQKGPGRSILGLGLDIGLDPTSYIPVGGVASILSKFKGAGKVLPEASNLQKFFDKGEIINPELLDLPEKSTVKIPEALVKNEPSVVTYPKDVLASKPFKPTEQQLSFDLPGVPLKLPIPKPVEKAVTAEPKIKKLPGQLELGLRVEDKEGYFVPLPKESALDLIDKVAKGDPEATLKVMPRPGIDFEPRHQNIADEILNKFDPKRSTAQINKKFSDTINPNQQVKLYNLAVEAVKKITKNPKLIEAHANKVYAAIEKTLRERGYVPRLHTGENVSLSDVIQQMGGPARAKEVLQHFPRNLTEKSPIWDAIQGIRAAGAIDESKSVKFIVDKTAETKAAVEASNTLSDVGEKKFNDFLKYLSKKTASAEEMSPAAITSAGKLIDYVVTSGKSAALVAIEATSKIIDEIVSKGRGKVTELNEVVTKSLEKDLGKLPAWSVNNNKAIEFLMARIATWWGQKDLRPFTLNAIGAAMATAAARGKALNRLFKGFDTTQRHEALAVAQGLRLPTSPETAHLADQISKMMDNLVGQVSGTSVILRSAVIMKMLNKWMKNYKVGFTFTNGKVKSITGEIVDYSKGTDWLNSWKTAEISEDPEMFLFKLQQAMEQSTREKALFDELGERFGAKVSGHGFSTKIEGHPYLEGYYFPEDVAKQIPRVAKDWTNPVHMSDPLMRHYDRLLSMWKSGVTIYRPGHHIRNLIGDAYLGWMDGVNSIRPYVLAARVQRVLKGMYPTLSDVDTLVELGVTSRKFSTPKPGETIFRNKSGMPFTAKQIAAVAHQKGLLEHARTIEDIIDLGETGRFKPFGGRVQQVARSASELISHNSRLAHFIDKVMKSRGNNLEDIFEKASRRARKWHPTGLDLTTFERKFLRRIIPFYSWLRKSTPLLLEGLVMNPGRAVIPSKVYQAVQESQGIETPSRTDPFPVDQMFPAWLRSEGVGPVSLPDGVLGKFSNQEPPGYVMAGQGLNPLSQLISQVQQPGKTLLSGLTPAAQIPLALSTGQNLFTGEPISGIEARPGAMREYIGSQIPIWNMIQGISGVTPFGTETKKAAKGSQATEAFINWLTGAGIKGTGPYVKQARFERNIPRRVQRQAGRQSFLEYLKGVT